MGTNGRRVWDQLIVSSFRFAERYLRVHVTPLHFYSPIPTTCELPPEVFDRVSDCVGLDWKLAKQIDLLERVLPTYLAEYQPPVTGSLSQVDAFVLYSLIRQRRPRIMVEVGSGESTRVALAAIRANAAEGTPGRLVAIEPYPLGFLRDLNGPDFELVEKRVQDVDPSRLTSAEILFIDSTHVAKIGSDVNWEMLEIVPRLKAGTLVHWHDVRLPAEYPRPWIEHGNRFWNEAYLLHAFMLFNRAFEVRWASHYLQMLEPGRLARILPFFAPDDPAQQNLSFWVERVGG